MRNIITDSLGLTKRQPELTPKQEEWVEDTFKFLSNYNPSQIIGRDYMTGKEIKDMAWYFLTWGPHSTYAAKVAEEKPVLPMLKEVILSQLLFSSLLMGKEVLDGFAQWAATPPSADPSVDSGGLGVTEAQINSAMVVAQSKLPTKSPEFVSDAPQSIQDAGTKMASVWEGFKVPVTFVSGSESGLRHYSVRFKKPPSTKISQVESNLEDALSHGGFHPEVSVVFTQLPDGEFEIHVPKERANCRAMSFCEYLLLATDYGRKSNGNRDLEDFINTVVDHYHPNANLRKAPEVPTGIDIYGKTAITHFGSGGIVVGAPNMGKSTHLKLVAIMLMLMLPPKMFRFAAIDLKDLAFSRFTKNWCNPWTLANVITSKNSQSLDTLFAALQDEKKARAKRLAAFGCENWLEYNEKNPYDPIPFSPLFIDEVSILKDFMDKADADYWIGEISSRWRYVGMPLIAGTQYAADQYGLSPMVRQNLETKVAFRADETCAKNAFDKAQTIKAVSSLLGGGDFIMKSSGMLIPTHGQGFDAPGKLIDQVIEVLKARFPEPSPESYLWFSDDEVDELSEDLWEEDRPSCPKCNEPSPGRWGRPGGKQKYRCKNKGCNHVFVS